MANSEPSLYELKSDAASGSSIERFRTEIPVNVAWQVTPGIAYSTTLFVNRVGNFVHVTIPGQTGLTSPGLPDFLIIASSAALTNYVTGFKGSPSPGIAIQGVSTALTANGNFQWSMNVDGSMIGAGGPVTPLSTGVNFDLQSTIIIFEVDDDTSLIPPGDAY